MHISNVIGAFSEEQVQKLTGITRSQLRYWDRSGFFVPSYADENRSSIDSRIYSFKDIVALRTLNMLRNQYRVSLQHLRQVRERLSALGEDRWTRVTLYVLNRKVVFDEPESGRAREVVSDQYVIGIPLKTVIADTKRDVQKMLRRDPSRAGGVVRSRHVNRNAWVMAGTRVPAGAIRRFHDAGYSVGQILAEYPDLTAEDVRAALAHADKASAAA